MILQAEKLRHQRETGRPLQHKEWLASSPALRELKTYVVGVSESAACPSSPSFWNDSVNTSRHAASSLANNRVHPAKAGSEANSWSAGRLMVPSPEIELN